MGSFPVFNVGGNTLDEGVSESNTSRSMTFSAYCQHDWRSFFCTKCFTSLKDALLSLVRLFVYLYTACYATERGGEFLWRPMKVCLFFYLS